MLDMLGLSEAGIVTIRRTPKVHPITALDTEYALWSRDPEDGILDVRRELGIGFVAYSLFHGLNLSCQSILLPCRLS